MKQFVLFLGLVITSISLAQEGFQLGLEASPSWDLHTHRNTTTGIRSSESGYGFNIGVPVKYWFSENAALHSGLTFEYMAFDNRVNNTLISSLRFGSLNVPVMINYKLSGGWLVNFGAGVKYHVLNQSWAGFGVDISNQINSFQPYAGFGISTLMERDNGTFELGARGRYHFLELYQDWTSNAEDFNNRIISFDLILRFYFVNR